MNYLDQTGLVYFWDKIKQHVTDEVTPINEKVFQAHGSASVSVSPSIIEKGVSTKVAVKNTVTFSGATYTPLSVNLKKGDSSLSTTPNGSVDDTVNDTTTYTMDVTFITNVSKTVSGKVTAVYPMYFGGNAATTLDSSKILAMTKQALKISPNGTYNVNVAQGNYMWLCIPSSMNINKVTSSGFDVPMESPSTVAVTGKENYKCYRSSSQFNAGTVNIVIS